MNTKLIASAISATLFLAATGLADTKNSVVGGYFQVERAVINGDVNAIKAAASDLAQRAGVANDDAIVKDADRLAKAESIDQARQLFETLSQETQNLIQAGESGQNMGCSIGGGWSDNPCSGMASKMPSCGAMMSMMRRCMQSSGCGGMGG
jgi:hypothetical protein